LISYFILGLICAGFVWYLSVVPRAPLPRDEIAALEQLVLSDTVNIPWKHPVLKVSALSGSFKHNDELTAFKNGLASSLANERVTVRVEGSPPSSLSSLKQCTVATGGDEANVACQESLVEASAQQAEFRHKDVVNEFDLLVVPTSGASALVLASGRSAVLRWHRGAALAEAEAVALAVAACLQQTWFRSLSLSNATALFEIAPSYVLSFFLVTDCQRRISWDFQGGVLEPFLYRFLSRLKVLFDFEIDSQVVQCGSLDGSLRSETSFGKAVISAATLQNEFMRQAGDWPGDSVTRDARWLPPLIRFVAFKPSGDVKVLDSDRRAQRSFAVQGWGAVAIAQTGHCNSSCTSEDQAPACQNVEVLSICDARAVTSEWVSSLRSWLELLPVVPEHVQSWSADSGLELLAARPQYDGITDWEMLLVARAVYGTFVRRTAETLVNLLDLIDSLPDVVVRAEIGKMAFDAVAAARAAAFAAQAGDLSAALSHARKGLHLALTATHDDTVVAERYFSWEFKYAVYLPLFMPMVVPIVFSLIRQLRHAAKLRVLERRSGEIKTDVAETVS